MVLWDYAKVAALTPTTFAKNVLRDNLVGWSRVNADGTTWNNAWWTPDCLTNGNLCATNSNLGAITVATEGAELVRWQEKTRGANVTVGAR
jgi:hypothetical protein